jgi:hypothetical protein
MNVYQVRGMTASSAVERQIILYSAGTADRRRDNAERVDPLVAAIDWPRLTSTLRRRRLLPTLGPRIAGLAGQRASEEFRFATDEAIVAARRHGGFLQLVTLRVLSMLAQAGIPAAPLKGPLFGETVYGDPGRRPSSDIDLLVSPQQLHAAVQVVRELGYGAPTDYVYDDDLPLLHFALTHEKGELPSIELHWRIHWYERAFARERLLPPVAGAQGDWRPAPVDELAALLLYYARDGFVGLRLASDLSAWWDVYGDDLEPLGLQPTLCGYPALGRALTAAALVAEKIVGVRADRILGGRSELGIRERAAARLANPHPATSLAQVYADIGLIDGLVMSDGGLSAFVRRHVFPPSEILDQQARHGARDRRRSSFSRGAGILARYGLTMSRLLRPPETLS